MPNPFKGTGLADADGYYLHDPSGNNILSVGTTVPADGSTGYATGAMFIKSNAVGGNTRYTNQGTATSSLFTAGNSSTSGGTFTEDFLNFDTTDQIAYLGVTGIAPATTANLMQYLYTPSGYRYSGWNIGTQTLIPVIVATGLDIGMDQTDNDGYELTTNCYGATGSPFVIGNSPAFFFEATVTIADVSGQDDFHVGFRRAETFNATFDNYLDLASIGLASADGAIKIETILANAATVTTDTTNTWADGATKVLKVLVSSAGVVTYTINGSAPTATAAYTFDNGIPVIPFVCQLQATTSPTAVVIQKWAVGYQ